LVKPSESYIPSRGDIVFLDFNPAKGHEQKGQRPALVVSPDSYNKKTSLALFMPITKQQKGYPFEVLIPDGLKTSGVILTDQIKSLDWRSRGVQFVESLPRETLEEVQARVEPLVLISQPKPRSPNSQ
jgi:mRNA interferase MazF